MRECSIPLFFLLIMTTACGGSGSIPTASPKLSGAYEFVVTSNVTGSTTLVEVNLAADGGQSHARGPNQVQILARENKLWYVNGVCFGANPGQNSITTSMSGNNISVAFNEGGNTFNGQGVLSGGTISGNYALSNKQCPDLPGIISLTPPGMDSGGFTGTPVPPLSGSFSGALTLLDGTDNATFTLAETANQALTVTAVLKGATDNGTFTFSGRTVGNIMFVSGTVNNEQLSLLGYFDGTGTFTGTANSLLVFNYVTLTNAGLLLRQ